jgi:UDP-N-acetylglucosamine acyltransferase
MTIIHPTAIVHPSAELADGVEIGPYTTIEADVRVGAGCCIGSYVTLGEHLRLGARVRIHNYACVGTASQDLKHHGELSYVEIGDDAIVREFATVNRGTREGSVTRVGPGAVLMAYSHVAHECVVEEGAVLVNAATLGGEVHIGKKAIVGGLVGIHQFCHVGAYAIVGAKSKLTQDLPPYLMADGHPARPFGPNIVGLRRNGFSEAQILEIRRIYRELFDRGRKFSENLALIEQLFGGSAEAGEILRFCQASTRGITRPRPRRGLAQADGSDFSVA